LITQTHFTPNGEAEAIKKGQRVGPVVQFRVSESPMEKVGSVGCSHGAR